jgi:hypothetical protein
MRSERVESIWNLLNFNKKRWRDLKNHLTRADVIKE